MVGIDARRRVIQWDAPAGLSHTKNVSTSILHFLSNKFQGSKLYVNETHLTLLTWSPECLGLFLSVEVDLLLAVDRAGTIVRLTKLLFKHRLGSLDGFQFQKFW